MTTIPASDLRPGDLIDTSYALTPGPVVLIRDVATIGSWTHALHRASGDLVPTAYVFRADQHVAVHRRAA